MMMRSNGGKELSLPDNWQKMDPAQKRQWRLNNFQNPEGINFVNPEALHAYQVRAKRLVDVYNVTEPDRVPISLPVGNLPYTLSGVNMRTVMYDYHQAAEAVKKFNAEYSSELEITVPFITPGRIMDILGYRLYAWPGHGLPIGAAGVQFIESEYMTDGEYDDLIRDPSNFWLRTYLPRVFRSFEPFRNFQPLTDMMEVVSLGQFRMLADPQVQETLLTLVEVGREYQKMSQVTEPLTRLAAANGFPTSFGIFAKAPFDVLGDTLRGTTGIMKDMYRRPDKVLEACDKIADYTISSILKSPAFPRLITVSYPLHKGADGWMSQKQFETFYWPSLKKVMNAFIDEGLIQSLFAEGSYNTRLESVNEFPKGFVTWQFDQTDMFRAKKILGDKCSIQGNVPSSLIVTGNPGDVKEYCRKLIEGCGSGGGYILAAGAVAENPKLANLRAMVQAANEYGYYKK